MRCRRESNADVVASAVARLVVCAVVSVTSSDEPRGDTGALVTAAYSIAASDNCFAAATVATTAANFAICVDVRVTCRAVSVRRLCRRS